MDNIHKHRRARLHHLIDTEFGGQRLRLCDKIGMSEARMGQLLSTTFRDGHNFGERVARKLERALQLPTLYFDEGANQLPNASSRADTSGQPYSPGREAHARSKSPLDQTEFDILQTYREAEPETQAAIRMIARTLRLADTRTIGELTHQYCRAIIDQLRLGFVTAPKISMNHFDGQELLFLANFRASNENKKQLILLAAACEPAQAGDADFDPETGCSRLELRLITCYRNGSETFKHGLQCVAAGNAPPDTVLQNIDAKQQRA